MSKRFKYENMELKYQTVKYALKLSGQFEKLSLSFLGELYGEMILYGIRTV